MEVFVWHHRVDKGAKKKKLQAVNFNLILQRGIGLQTETTN